MKCNLFAKNELIIIRSYLFVGTFERCEEIDEVGESLEKV
jgi:hypothetical protein